MPYRHNFLLTLFDITSFKKFIDITDFIDFILTFSVLKILLAL